MEVAREWNEWFEVGIADAQPFDFSTETDWKAETDQSLGERPDNLANDKELQRYSPDRYLFDERLDNLAKRKEGATSKLSAFLDSILHGAYIYILLVLVLVLLYVNHMSLYQVPLCVSSITLLFLYLYINHAPFLFLEEDIKWIRRESRLLHAISEDAAEVKRLYAKIGTRAHQIWDSDKFPSEGESEAEWVDKTVASDFFPSEGESEGESEEKWVDKTVAVAGLDETEAKWVEKTVDIVLKAQCLVKALEEKRGDSHRVGIFFGLTVKSLKQTDELFSETKRIKEEIKGSIVRKKKFGINICQTLERLRSNVRRLLERPFDEHEQRWGNFGERVALAACTVERINSLITQNPDLVCDTSTPGDQMQSINLQLQLLHPFLKDIQGFDRFESAIEKAWVEEVEEIIDEAKLAINNFLHRPSYRFRWLSFISRWKARGKLKGDLRCTDFGLAQVLERKERYGFKFIRRYSSKFINQSPQETTDHNNIVSSMRTYLREKSDVLGEVFSEVASLYKRMKGMQKLVGDAAVIEGRYNSRMAWLEQTRKIVQSAEYSVETFVEKDIKVEKRSAGIKLSCKINRINHTIDLLLRCIKAFSIELREDSSSVVGLGEDIDAVVSKLRTNNEHCSVISIWGIEGIGKTTLAKKIYNHGVVVEHFPRRAWVSLPRDYSYNSRLPLLEDVANQVLSSLKSEGNQEINDDASSRINKALDILKQSRYLLVLDNISKMEEWNFLEVVLPLSTSSGSRILTTRDQNLASQTDSQRCPHELRGLTKEESWQLFSQVVNIPPEGKMLAKEILSICGGLPLAIVRLMSGKDETTAKGLKRVIQFIKKTDREPLCTDTIECLVKLPVHLKDCLSCFKLFPRDYKIPVRRLFSLWIAEDLVLVSERKTDTDKSDPKKKGSI